MRYFALISYNGTGFFGWQKQTKSNNTVQYHIDNTLSMLLREPVSSVGCGRTDTGVHASGYYLHFDVQADFEEKDIVYKLNQILPPQIAVHAIFKVRDDLHARFHATSRSYVYRIKTYKDPFDHLHYYYKSGELHLNRLNEIAELIQHKNDFFSYCKSQDPGKTTLCSISHSDWKMVGNTFEFHITANRFLRGMIRLLVGMMLNYNKGKITLDNIEASFSEKDKLPQIWSAPADGLILHKILYDEQFNVNESALLTVTAFKQ